MKTNKTILLFLAVTLTHINNKPLDQISPKDETSIIEKIVKTKFSCNDIINEQTKNNLKISHPQGLQSFFEVPQSNIGKRFLSEIISNPTNKKNEISMNKSSIEWTKKNKTTQTWLKNNKPTYTAIANTLLDLKKPKNESPLLNTIKDDIWTQLCPPQSMLKFSILSSITAYMQSFVTTSIKDGIRSFIKNPIECIKTITSPSKVKKKLKDTYEEHRSTFQNPQDTLAFISSTYGESIGLNNAVTQRNKPECAEIYSRINALKSTISFIENNNFNNTTLKQIKQKITTNYHYKSFKKTVENTPSYNQYFLTPSVAYQTYRNITIDQNYACILKDLIAFIGYIDAYNAIGKTIKNKQMNSVTFSDDQSISIKNAKNPIGKNSNNENININSNTTEITKNPENATKFLQSIAYNQILAQTIGYINSAEKNQKTSLFDNIVYQDASSENIQKGLSTGTIQLKNFANIKNSISPKKKSLFLLDNPLAGTTISLGKKLFSEYKQQLKATEYKKCVRSVISTNFKQPNIKIDSPENKKTNKIPPKKSYKFLVNASLLNQQKNAINTAELWGTIEESEKALLNQKDIAHLNILGKNSIGEKIQNSEKTPLGTWTNLKLAEILSCPLHQKEKIEKRKKTIQNTSNNLFSQDLSLEFDTIQSIINEIKEYNENKPQKKWTDCLKRNPVTLGLYRTYKVTKNRFILPYFNYKLTSLAYKSLPKQWKIKEWKKSIKNLPTKAKKELSIKEYTNYLKEVFLPDIKYIYKRPTIKNIIQETLKSLTLGITASNIIAKITMSNPLENIHPYAKSALLFLSQSEIESGSYKYSKDNLFDKINTIRIVTEEIKKLPILENDQPELASLHKKLINSHEFKKLSQSVSFTKNRNWLFQKISGLNLIVTYRKLLRDRTIQKGLAKITQFIGHAQALKRLNSKLTNKKNINCVELLDNKDPYIELKNAAYPFKNDSIKNTIVLGKNSKRNMHLVAPNGSGKSFLQKTALLNTIMAQSTGYAFVEKGSKLTPFEILGTTTNLTMDHSFYNHDAEETFEQTKDIINSEKNKDKNKFIIIDEPLSKLYYKDAQKRVPELLHSLENNEKTVSIIVTHFDLNKDSLKTFKDASLEVQYNTKESTEKKFKTTFKLQDHTKNDWWLEKEKEDIKIKQKREEFVNWRILDMKKEVE